MKAFVAHFLYPATKFIKKSDVRNYLSFFYIRSALIPMRIVWCSLAMLCDSDLELKPVGTLEVKLVQAKDLANKDLIGKSDPFAVLFVRLLRSRMKTSKTIVSELTCPSVILRKKIGSYIPI